MQHQEGDSLCPNLIGGGYRISKILAALVLSLITALNGFNVPCKAEETRAITIQFDGGGATAGTMETIKLSDGNSAMAIPENQFERSGYLFSHWYITDGKNTYTALGR